MNDLNIAIAILTARVFLGVLFVAQGYDKIFRLKIRGEVDAMKDSFGHAHIPEILLTAAAYLTSYIELIGGILLIAGLYTNITLYALGLDLIIVSIGFSILKPMWDMQFVFPRLLLVLLLLLLPPEYNFLSIDRLLN